MSIKRFGRATAIGMSLALVWAAVAIAADGVVMDPDGVLPFTEDSSNPSRDLGNVCLNTPAGGQVLLKAINGSGQTWDNGATVTVAGAGVTGTNAADVTVGVGAGADSTIVLPSNWNSLAANTLSEDSAVGTFSVTSSVLGAHSANARWNATGAGISNAQQTPNLKIDWNVIDCTPSNTAPSVSFTSSPATANEGDTKTYTFSITDPDADTWSFASSYPSCGTGGSLVANSDSIDQTAKTGTFQCFFPDGPASPTVAVKINDGTADSNEASQAVTVSNVKPTPSIDSLTGNSGVACLAGNTVTLDFSWTDPAGANDTYSYSVNWGHGSPTTASNQTSPISNVQHTYPAGGPYTIVVTVNDEDAGTGGTASSSAFSFLYNVSGVLQPVNNTQAQNDPSIFKYGSTIPVKISVTDCDGTPVSGLSPQISVKKISGSTPPSGTDETISSTSGADSGTTMRYSDGIYIYNLATKSLADSSATYEIKITGPFTTVTAQFGTKSK